MIIAGESTVKDAGKDDNGKFIVWRRASLASVIVSASSLVVATFWLCTAHAPGEASSPLFTRLKWWSQPWGVYVPLVTGARDTVASEGALVVTGMFSGLTLATATFHTVLANRRRRARVVGLACLVACGWLAIGLWYENLRLRAESADLRRYANRVQEFAESLNAAWPSEGGEIENFGAFLAYPYGRPRTLLMLGDARIPATPLRVAAVEWTANEAIRFQLTGDAPDVWFEWRPGRDSPNAFVGGLAQVFNAVTYLQLNDNLYVVRYVQRDQAGPTD